MSNNICYGLTKKFDFCFQSTKENEKYCFRHNQKINCLIRDFKIEKKYYQDILINSYPYHISIDKLDNIFKKLNLQIPECLTVIIYKFLPNPIKILRKNNTHINHVMLMHSSNLDITRYEKKSITYSYKNIIYNIHYLNGKNQIITGDIILKNENYNIFNVIQNNNNNFGFPFSIYNINFNSNENYINNNHRTIIISHNNSLNLYKINSISFKSWYNKNQNMIYVHENYIKYLCEKIIYSIYSYKTNNLIREIPYLYSSRLIKIKDYFNKSIKKQINLYEFMIDDYNLLLCQTEYENFNLEQQIYNYKKRLRDIHLRSKFINKMGLNMNEKFKTFD